MMATSLSSYWVKFFTAAGFPLDVATKHAVVFSNNRIKPDMLPDLDKPSLKEMGITLMGDMIAILRYAKKVTEDMTCEKFLVDTEEPKLISKSPNNPKVIQKKVVTKISSVGVVNKSTEGKDMKSVATKNNLKNLKPSSSISTVPGLKKKLVSSATRVVTPLKKSLVADTMPKKRKVIEVIDDLDSSEDESDDNQVQIQKRLKTSNDDGVYQVIVNKKNNLRGQDIREVTSIGKKTNDQKRTVFDRLGDSSVTSTTNLNDNNTTFSITGIGTDAIKRNSSVFNRLGDKDLKKDSNSAGILKNGNNLQPQGILKSKPVGSSLRSPSVQMVKLNTKGMKVKTGTMHADHEGIKKVSTSIKQLVRNTKAMKLNNVPSITRKIPNNKLASERINSLPAKARLGLGGLQKQQKQVTFNKVATVTHIKKPGVFSRLGI
ncbi:uncharacterized protein C19orf47 homolog [Chelonus insularis]|uniref:uncharacterized protein C19orf47 homolog n=1 Tax=Chelonus insularis TaxID=460826 RepID=UPI00158ECB42|nr:uncharacterized protein C19orf47 homolog [Chelonus insularis]